MHFRSAQYVFTTDFSQEAGIQIQMKSRLQQIKLVAMLSSHGIVIELWDLSVVCLREAPTLKRSSDKNHSVEIYTPDKKLKMIKNKSTLGES